jgi:tRNA1Val (adenine37-N6)-methyltransferase
VNERSAMKVNTDGVLLGALMTIKPTDRRLLDIGTGTGTIALMAAQREIEQKTTDVAAPPAEILNIDAIDIDEPSASEAAVNFQNSPWSVHLNAYNLPLDAYADELDEFERFDLIFSNPPYFEDSLTAPDSRKSTARHTSDGLSYRDIFEFASERLNEDGRVALVLPSDQETAVCRHARMCGLHLYRILRIRTVPRKDPKRMIVEFSRHRADSPHDSILTIQNEGKYTQEYLSLTHDFYLFA